LLGASERRLLYVCDRAATASSLHKQGRFLKEFFIANERCARLAARRFSPDPEQKYIFVAEIVNNVVWSWSARPARSSDKIGHTAMPRQFHFVQSPPWTPRATFYTGEVDSGKRVQKFVPTR